MFESIHLASLVLTIPFILYADHLGLSYIAGKKKLLKASTIEKLHLIVFLGLMVLIITGVVLTAPSWNFYVNDRVFQLKMFFVMTLFLNGVFIGRLMRVASVKPFNKLQKPKKFLLLLSGSLSLISWISSAVIGYFFL